MSDEPAPTPQAPSPPGTDGSAPPPAARAGNAAAPHRAYQARAKGGKGCFVSIAGLLLLMIGICWLVVEGESGWVTKSWIFASSVMVLVPLAWHLPDLVGTVMSRRGEAVLYVFATILLGLFIAVFAGWATSGTRKSALPSIDLTKSARFTLTDESAKLLAKVEGTVYATYLMRGDTTDQGLREAVLDQLRVFEGASTRVRVAEADEVRKPDVAARILREAGVQTTTSGEDTDLLVLTYAEPGKEVAPGKQKEIKVESWAFHKESSTGAVKWLGESVVSDGIYELVFQKFKAYATGGHGERSLSADYRSLSDALLRQNIEVASSPLVLGATPAVPADCELLFVLAPTAPFTPEEAEAVSRWLDKGKALFVTLDVADERASTGLDALLDKYGISTRTNYEVVAPRVQRVNIDQHETPILQDMNNQFPVYGGAYADHPAVKALRARGGLATYFVSSTYLEVDEKPPAGADTAVVCYAPSYGTGGHAVNPVALRHTRERKDYGGVIEGVDVTGKRLPLVATGSRQPQGEAKGDARLVISGDSDVFSDLLIQRFPANLDLVRGLVQWGLHREGLVAVSDRTLEDPYVTPTEYQKRFAFWWPMAVIFLPLLLGGAVWWSRRR